MRHSIATVSLSGTLPEKLAAIAAARFDGVEIFESDLVFFNGRPQDVRRIVADHGLTMDLFQPFRDFEAVSPTQFLRNLDRAERKFDVMGELGATLMLVCSNVSPETIDDAALAADQLRQLATRAATRGIRIGYEALSWGARTKSFAQAWSIIDMAAHSSLGLIVDSFHTLVLPDEWSTLKNLPGEKIFFVQLADAPKLGMNPLMLSRHFRCLDNGPHLSNRRPHLLFAEERCATDECVRACARAVSRRGKVDAAVHLDPILQRPLAPPGGGLLNLGQRLRNERLATEARVDRHDEQQVDLFQERFGLADGRGRIDRKPDFFAERFNFPKQRQHAFLQFDMDRDRI